MFESGNNAAGQAALMGWRRRIGEPVARKVAERTGLDAARVEGLIGLAFVTLSALYVARAVARMARAH